MVHYPKQSRILVAVDCIIFGFDGSEVKLLLIHRGFVPEKGKWSLMGGFVQKNESLEEAAARVLKTLTGLDGVYMEQLHTFSDQRRDPVERTISVTYFALIDIHQYEDQLSDQFRPEWFSLKKIPALIFDHAKMVEMARQKLRYKAAIHPILFELLPKKFTIPQLQLLYESVFDQELDKRNFSRKVLSTGLVVKLKEKEKRKSRRGAFYFRLNKKNYSDEFHSIFNFIPNPELV